MATGDETVTVGPTKREQNLAWRLLLRETGGGRGADALARATQASFDRLYRRLSDLVGPAGFDALARRALHLAAEQCPYLKSVVVEQQADSYHLRGLQASVEGRSAAEIRQALSVLLGAFFWLLDTFVGDRLFWKLLRGVWADLPADTSGLDSEEIDP